MIRDHHMECGHIYTYNTCMIVLISWIVTLIATLFEISSSFLTLSASERRTDSALYTTRRRLRRVEEEEEERRVDERRLYFPAECRPFRLCFECLARSVVYEGKSSRPFIRPSLSLYPYGKPGR